MTGTMSNGAAGKAVLITGASSGIGAETAATLAARGHQVMLGARRTDRLRQVTRQIADAGGTADAVQLDVTDLESVRAAVSRTVERYGRLDVLVNNAGVMPLAPLEKDLVSEWNWILDVNVRGVLHAISATLPVMRDQHAGHIVNIASTAAYEVLPGAAVYCASKFAVRVISEALRRESPPWLRVTCVSPGPTESELAEHISDPEMRDFIDGLRRHALPASAIADAISFAVNADEAVDVNEMIVRPVAQRS